MSPSHHFSSTGFRVWGVYIYIHIYTYIYIYRIYIYICRVQGLARNENRSEDSWEGHWTGEPQHASPERQTLLVTGIRSVLGASQAEGVVLVGLLPELPDAHRPLRALCNPEKHKTQSAVTRLIEFRTLTIEARQSKG